jgi:hypothetical protein
MYLPNNPQYKMFMGRAVEKFQDFFGSYPALSLEVKPFELLFGEEVVYENKERSDSIAYVLFRDGIRKLSLRAGIDEKEITAFVLAFRRDFTREYFDDDMVTYFWQQDFQYINYVSSDEFMDEYLPESVKQSENRDQALIEEADLTALDLDQLKELVTSGSDKVAVPLKMSHLAGLINPLSDEEGQKLEETIQVDLSKPALPILLDAIFQIIKSETDRTAIEEFFTFILKILNLELSNGRFESAAGILDKITRVNDRMGSYPGPVVERARIVLNDLASLEFIDQVLTPAIIAEDADKDALAVFIAAMPVVSAVSLLDLFEKVTSMKMRKHLCVCLADLIKDDINAIVDGLEDDRWFVVRNTVFVLGMVKDPQATIYLKKALTHPDVRVRREAIRAALSLERADIEDYILAAVDDPDEKVRLFTLKNIVGEMGDRVAGRLAELISAPDFKKRSDRERRQFYSALARMGIKEHLAPLNSILKKKSWLSKDTVREQRWVTEALSASGSPDAMKILAGTSDRGSPSIMSLGEKIIKDLRGTKK